MARRSRPGPLPRQGWVRCRARCPGRAGCAAGWVPRQGSVRLQPFASVRGPHRARLRAARAARQPGAGSRGPVGRPGRAAPSGHPARSRPAPRAVPRGRHPPGGVPPSPRPRRRGCAALPGAAARGLSPRPPPPPAGRRAPHGQRPPTRRRQRWPDAAALVPPRWPPPGVPARRPGRPRGHSGPSRHGRALPGGLRPVPGRPPRGVVPRAPARAPLATRPRCERAGRAPPAA